MIESTTKSGLYAAANPTKKNLSFVENERTSGKIPSWHKPKTNIEQIEQKLENAQNQQETFKSTLSYIETSAEEASLNSEEFGFSDLIDMVNPLHHVPIVGHLYRSFTGDEIKPIGNIIGGAVFGGPVGAASGLINTVVEAETGKDLTENALAFTTQGEMPSFKSTAQNPEKRLNNVSLNEPHDLPASLLSFTNTSIKHDNIRIERIESENNKIAQKREPITTVKLSGLYALGQD